MTVSILGYQILQAIVMLLGALLGYTFWRIHNLQNQIDDMRHDMQRNRMRGIR